MVQKKKKKSQDDGNKNRYERQNSEASTILIKKLSQEDGKSPEEIEKMLNLFHNEKEFPPEVNNFQNQQERLKKNIK